MANPHSFYFDNQGELDLGLRRGSPLKLDLNRYAVLKSTVRTKQLHNIIARNRNSKYPQECKVRGYF